MTYKETGYEPHAKQATTAKEVLTLLKLDTP